MKNALIILLGVLVFIGGVAGAGSLTPEINQQRKELNLTVSDDVHNLPADMAVAQAALGTFRGVAVNVLWQRAENLKNEGKFYEAVQLGEMITTLQPRFPKVWEFVSWNQAYNISVATHTPEERWFWVKSGIDLLQNRGKGIDSNPNSLPLYRQLGWIYFHKVGGFQDNMSWYYKQQLADKWHAILGPAPTDREQYLEWFAPVAEAPDSRMQLPEGARQLIEWLIENDHPLNYQTLRRLTVPVRLEEVEVPADAQSPQGPTGSLADGETRTMVVPMAELQWPEDAAAEDIDTALAFLQRQAIAGPDTNMDADYMYEMGQKYGPIDWRHPAAHALYWAQLGLDRIFGDEGRSTEGALNTRRNILNSLQTLAQAGHVVYQPALAGQQPYISYLPVWPFWLSYDRTYQELKRDSGDPEGVERSYGSGYRNQMDAAIINAYLFGEPDVANELLDQMNESYAGQIYGERYQTSLDEFVEREIQDIVENPDQARTTVLALLTSSLSNSVLYGRQREAQEQFQSAQRIHGEYRALNPNPNDPLYQEMPDFPELRLDAIGNFIAGNAGPLGVQQIPIEVRVNMYQSLPAQDQVAIYAKFGELYQQQARQMGLDPQSVFPAPAGYQQGQRSLPGQRTTGEGVDQAETQRQ